MTSKKVFSRLLAITLLAGCSAAAGGPDLLLRYQAFKTELSKPVDERRHEQFVSQRIRDEVAAASTESKDLMWAQAEFPLWLAEVASHYQTRTGDGQMCLTLNGTLANSEGFGTLALEYVLERGQLVVNDIFYQYLEGPEAFASEPRCPADFVLDFPF